MSGYIVVGVTAPGVELIFRVPWAGDERLTNNQMEDRLFYNGEYLQFEGERVLNPEGLTFWWSITASWMLPLVSLVCVSYKYFSAAEFADAYPDGPTAEQIAASMLAGDRVTVTEVWSADEERKLGL